MVSYIILMLKNGVASGKFSTFDPLLLKYFEVLEN